MSFSPWFLFAACGVTAFLFFTLGFQIAETICQRRHHCVYHALEDLVRDGLVTQDGAMACLKVLKAYEALSIHLVIRMRLPCEKRR